MRSKYYEGPRGCHTSSKNKSTQYSLLTAHYSLLATHYSLLATHCTLFTTHCSLLTAHCSLLTAQHTSGTKTSESTYTTKACRRAT